MPSTADQTLQTPRGSRNHMRTQTPRQWFEEVAEFATRAPSDFLCSGTHIKNFSEYLEQPYRSWGRAEARSHARDGDQREGSQAFAVLYDFQCSEPRQDLWEPSDLDLIAERNAMVSAQSQLLFMRGSPSPSWINAIGASFGIPWDFFDRHFQPFLRQESEAAWNSPPLASERMRELHLPLIARFHLHETSKRARQEAWVSSLRDRAEHKFGEYLNQVRTGTNLKVGDPLLRNMSVHSESNFSIEQMVSVRWKRTDVGWPAVVWLDVGDDLSSGPLGDWFRNVMDYRRDNIIMDPMVLDRKFGTELAGPLQQTEIPQTARHLCHEYEHGLDPVLARADCFYALGRIIRYAAASELAFLNMMRHVLHCDTYHGILKRQNDSSLANLHYNRTVLKEHVRSLSDSVRAIQSGQWPSNEDLNDDQLRRLASMKQATVEDFQDLMESFKDLAKEHEMGVKSVMGLSSYAESQKVIVQAQSVEWLARLGTIFLPLSLLTSFFGMNASVFGDGSLPLWIFFAIAMPVLLLSLLLLVPKAKMVVPGLRLLQRARQRSAAGHTGHAMA